MIWYYMIYYFMIGYHMIRYYVCLYVTTFFSICKHAVIYSWAYLVIGVWVHIMTYCVTEYVFQHIQLWSNFKDTQWPCTTVHSVDLYSVRQCKTVKDSVSQWKTVTHTMKDRVIQTLRTHTHIIDLPLTKSYQGHWYLFQYWVSTELVLS